MTPDGITALPPRHIEIPIEKLEMDKIYLRVRQGGFILADVLVLAPHPYER